MNYRIVTLEADARTVEQQQDKLLGYPAKGVHVGGGRHVPMPDQWDGEGSVPPGWSSYRGSSLKNSKQEYATPIDPQVSAALANGRRTRLSAAEQTKMAADLAAAKELPVDWSEAAAVELEIKRGAT